MSSVADTHLAGLRTNEHSVVCTDSAEHCSHYSLSSDRREEGRPGHLGVLPDADQPAIAAALSTERDPCLGLRFAPTNDEGVREILGESSQRLQRARPDGDFGSRARRRVAVIGAGFRQNPVFWLGMLAIAVPTFIGLTTTSWSDDQAGHAPIVLATAVWLFFLNGERAASSARLGSGLICAAALSGALLVYGSARITGLLEIQALAAYFVFVSVLYGVGGTPVLRILWFPIAYSLFLVPIPGTIIDIGTQPIKIAISDAVVGILSFFDYPIASSGVSIYIGPFELLIAAACAGLNSLISLTAIGTFYVYLRRNATWFYTVTLLVFIFPIAVIANFIRVLFLVLLTYYAGESVAQGFLHEFAGIFMFVIALMLVFLVDRIASAIGSSLQSR